MSRPEADAGTAVARILAALPAAGSVTEARPPIVLIDGFSGAGKSTLADSLLEAWPGARLVRLEHIYPGWDGLEAASAAVYDDILVPLAAGLEAGWRGWDWVTDGPAARHPVDPAAPLVIEGAGALSRRNRRLASLGVWLELDTATRRMRALARDGATYEPHWDRWAAQEATFAERERPRRLADVLVRQGD